MVLSKVCVHSVGDSDPLFFKKPAEKLRSLFASANPSLLTLKMGSIMHACTSGVCAKRRPDGADKFVQARSPTNLSNSFL